MSRRPVIVAVLLGFAATLAIVNVSAPAVSAPAVAALDRPVLPQPCTKALGDHLRLRDEQRDANGTVLARALPGSAPLAYEPDVLGGYTPVLLVHGFKGHAGFRAEGWPKDGPFDRPIKLTAGSVPFKGLDRSLVGQFQAIRGAAVYELDYRDRNTQWVAGDDNAGARVARAIDCLYAGLGRRVVVVAHSMGGLATRWALTDAGDAGGRAGRVSTVVTFGTPYTGSALADAGRKLVGDGDGSKVVGALGNIVEWYNKARGACEGKTDDQCSVIREELKGLDTSAGRALRSDSAEIADLKLKKWPAGIRVHALAGQIELQGVMCTTMICAGGRVLKLGDTAVLTDSATAQATTTRTTTCKYQYNASVLGIWQAVRTVVASPCQHSNLMAEQTLANDAVAEVADAVADTTPAGCPSTSDVDAMAVRLATEAGVSPRPALASLRESWAPATGSHNPVTCAGTWMLLDEIGLYSSADAKADDYPYLFGPLLAEWQSGQWKGRSAYLMPFDCGADGCGQIRVTNESDCLRAPPQLRGRLGCGCPATDQLLQALKAHGVTYDSVSLHAYKICVQDWVYAPITHWEDQQGAGFWTDYAHTVFQRVNGQWRVAHSGGTGPLCFTPGERERFAHWPPEMRAATDC